MVGDGFKALSDPMRRRILELLGERDMTAGEIGEHFPQNRARRRSRTTSRSCARRASCRRSAGRNVLYRLDTTVLQGLISWFLGLTETEASDEG